ncbi:ParA family protein [Aliivibrio sp. S3MY1]|uniref:ParA family protein n=1 Tax=unclassified Aliivibrio TaxID=2645654 RepID=UPI002379BCB5|nr:MULTISPECIES: ParA family protein [unclassified Aliivibrio]MDD9197573.1 ParA family protein [Aliivibrio sp. S3MY1]MDD9200826.1 ParA family protein [Aliivibrio sp. S2MY1]
MVIYSIWNNKGGTGKTSLSFQAVTRFAELNPEKKILVVDLCPQANLTEIFLGGQEGSGSEKLLLNQGQIPRRSIGGYFDARLKSPYSAPNFVGRDFICLPNEFNSAIATNIDLICGDALLELQAIAMNTLANADIPGVNSWLGIIDWLKELLDQVDYDYVFIDTNPSFSMYTQIGLAASHRVILPVMADDSSRRAIQNAFSLIYGLKLPSEVYKNYTFAKKLNDAGRSLPMMHLIVKNRLTQYMGTSSAYNAALTGIEKDLAELISLHPQYFTFTDPVAGSVDVRDFGTTGVVAFARGCPFSKMPHGKLTVSGKRINVRADYKENMIKTIDELVARI